MTSACTKPPLAVHCPKSAIEAKRIISVNPVGKVAVFHIIPAYETCIGARIWKIQL